MIWLVLIFALAASPAAADPISAVIISSFGITGVVGTAFVRIGVGLALSQLAKIKAKRSSPTAADPGIQAAGTTAGGVVSQTIILGEYITGGNMVAPSMSHGKAQNAAAPDAPNSILTYVMDLCDLELSGLLEIHVNDTVMNFASHFAAGISDNLGRVCTAGVYSGKLWADLRQVNNTAVNPRLQAIYGSRSTRPWLADMLGRGTSYIALHFEFDREIYQAEPRVQFVVQGIPLYDPRKDSTAGGSGTHRWGQVATYEFTENAMVMIYNLLRGITVRADLVYGVGVAGADLPLDVWAAAMNACGTNAYRAGVEIRIADDDPLTVVDELLKACDGDIADVGGKWLARIGGPSLPVAFITDDDILRNHAQELDPFPSLAETYNGVHVNFLSKASKWQPKDAPPRYDLIAEAADGRRLTADVSLPAVTSMTQAQRLGRAWLLDARRMRRHTIVLGPEGLLVNPLDCIQWDSDRNGYITKQFEVGQRVVDTMGLSCTFAIRERDPSDYNWSPEFELPTTAPSPDVVVPAAQVLPGFALSPYEIRDNVGARRPAMLMTWTGRLPDVRAIRWEIRNAATLRMVASGSFHGVEAGELAVTTGIVPNVTYQARAIMVMNRPSAWTAWQTATAPNILISGADVGNGAIGRGNIAGEAVTLDLYSENASTTAINAGDGWVTVGQIVLDRVVGFATKFSTAVVLRPNANIEATLFNIRIARSGTPFRSYASAILKPDSASAIYSQTFSFPAVDPSTAGGIATYTVQIDGLNSGLFTDYSLIRAFQTYR